MHSPPIEWALGIGHLVALDLLRDQGEPDADTLSEVLRVAFGVHRPEGRVALAAAIAGGGVLLYRHLAKPEMRLAPTSRRLT